MSKREMAGPLPEGFRGQTKAAPHAPYYEGRGEEDGENFGGDDPDSSEDAGEELGGNGDDLGGDGASPNSAPRGGKRKREELEEGGEGDTGAPEVGDNAAPARQVSEHSVCA